MHRRTARSSKGQPQPSTNAALGGKSVRSTEIPPNCWEGLEGEGVSKGPDLFASAVEERLARKAPLAARLRPRTLDEVVGQKHLLGPGKPLRVLIESDRLSSVIIWGPPGTGKTTIARLVAGVSEKAFETLRAVSAGVKDVREVAERARARLGERGQGTILFLDEVHRFSRAQQDVLLPFVEE